MATAHTGPAGRRDNGKMPGPAYGRGTSSAPEERRPLAASRYADGFFVSDGHTPTVRELLAARSPRRWLLGAGISCLVLVVSSWRDFAVADSSAPAVVLRWAMLPLFIGVFLAGPPLSWYRTQRVKHLLAAGFFALSLGFLVFPNVSLGVT